MGITLPIELASSLTVVLPKFCVVISLSEILSAVPAFSPYAFIVVVSTSTDVFMSVKPPTASAFAVATNSTDFDTSTPADIAL